MFTQDASVLRGLDFRDDDHYGISIDIPTVIVKVAKIRFADAAWVQEIPNHLLLRDDNQISVAFNVLGEDARDWLYEQMSDAGHKVLAGTIEALRAAERDPANSVITSLLVLSQAIATYIDQNSIDGWIYETGQNGEALPWLVTHIGLQEMSNGQQCLSMHITANSVAMSNNDYSRPNNRSVFFFLPDVINRTVSDIMSNKGFLKESAALKQAYEKSLETFVNFMPKISAQFRASGSALEVDLSKQYHTPEALKLSGISKVVNDEDLVRRKFFTHAESPFWENQNRQYTSIPIHPMILCFNLETHSNMWIHVDNLVEYQYDPSLKDKLILPPRHRDLIDILTQDMDVLMEDIVAGKSGGTTILCKGAPGLGKTLTAEVYAEVVQRPLYRVHSGQLGIHSADVEKSLEAILKRAQRWGAVPVSYTHLTLPTNREV